VFIDNVKPSSKDGVSNPRSFDDWAIVETFTNTSFKQELQLVAPNKEVLHIGGTRLLEYSRGKYTRIQEEVIY